MALLQRIIKNDSIKSDPPEIYNVRVFLVSLVVSRLMLSYFSLSLISIVGLCGGTSFRNGYGDHGRCVNHDAIQRACISYF